MKNVVDLHGGRELKLISERTNTFEHFERPKIAVHELLDTVKLEAQVLGVKQNKVTNVEMEVPTTAVGKACHELLCFLEAGFGKPEGSLDVLHPSSRRSTSQRNEAVSRSPGVFTIVEKEGSRFDGGLIGIVDGKFHQRKANIPVILGRIYIGSEDGLNIVIHPFSLPISLRVKGSGEILLNL
jgi:hypothetical protein